MFDETWGVLVQSFKQVSLKILTGHSIELPPEKVEAGVGGDILFVENKNSSLPVCL